MLIKSSEVIREVNSNANNIQSKFLQKHEVQLSQVFNRHKRILIALKTGASNKFVKTLINRIGHLSKNTHIPIKENKNKTFVNDVLKDGKVNVDALTLRDKFKILNLLEFKLLGLSVDIFTIRNGRIHIEVDRPVYNQQKINSVIDLLIQSISNDLLHLKDKVIVLPDNIDYGLPVSRKQSLGHLPYGTTIKIDDKCISSGIYWQNDWGARDLDLQAIDISCVRTGWGQISGYNGLSGIDFSGDLVNAENGAMEFLTSNSEHYGLFVNIFNGNVGAKSHIVVGS